MTTTGKSKLNMLYTRLAPSTPLTSDDLAAMDISADLAVHYVRAGWLVRLARGVYGRPNDIVALPPSLLLLQGRFKRLHVGAHTALDWNGLRTYVAQQPVLHLRAWTATRPPVGLTGSFAVGSQPKQRVAATHSPQ